MSLRVWLPLNGDLRNQGLDGNVSVTNNGAVVNNSGKIGACYSFGTAKSYFKFDDVSFMHSFTECSITLWLKIISWNTSYATYFQFGLGSTPWSNYIFGLLRNNATSKLCFSIAKGSSSSQTSCSTPELQLNTWYHFSFIYTSGHCKIYIDGIETTDLSTTIVPNFADITTGTIGACNNGSSYQTNCLLNDFRIYDHALSEKEVKEIAKGLILHYKLDNLMGNINDNLAKNSKMLDINSSINNQNISKRGTATLEIIDNNFVRVKATAAWQGFSLWSNSLNLEVGTTYTYSFYAYTNSEDNTNAAISFYPMMYNSSGSRDTSSKLPISVLGSSFQDVNSRYIGKLTTKLTLYWATFTWNQTMADILSTGGKIELSIQIHGTFNNGRIDYLQLPKLEIGDNPTMWCPSFSEIGTIPFTQLEDTSGYGHNGQIVSNINISSDTMRYNTSALFDGVDDCIIVPYNAICPENIFTINLWFKKDALGSKKYETLFGGPSGFEMDTRAGASTALSLYMASTRGGNAATGLQLNTWYMVTMVRDGINERYYINSELKKEIEAKAMPTGVYRIGAWASNTGQNYYGNISDFRIYCTALSADDIKELYQTSASIDDKQNFYSRELSNSLHDTTSITQAGIALADDFVEDTVAAIKDDRSIESNCFYEY